MSFGTGRAFYASRFADDGLLVVPGVVLDKATWLRSVDDEPAWQSYRVTVNGRVVRR